MAIEIRVESYWDTDDGEGRAIEVTVCERRHPTEDPIEDTQYFAGGDLEALKRHLASLIEGKSKSFHGRHLRECSRCGRVRPSESTEAKTSFLCSDCSPPR